MKLLTPYRATMSETLTCDFRDACNRLQHKIPCGMSISVVDMLEEVDVKH